MPKDKIRLDQLLVKKGLAETREKAKAIIMSGAIFINGKRIEKPGQMVSISSDIYVRDIIPKYVSRGGTKLEGALKELDVDVRDKVFLDIGASTGGFTDCLLQHGARKVIAIDVGYGQLHWKLRKDPRVKILEKTNARYLTPQTLDEKADGAVIDVSFISLKLIIPPVSQLLKDKAIIIALIKPQFEAGKRKVGKKGVVRDPLIHQEITENISHFCTTLGWSVVKCIPSPLLGPKGNKEFFIYLVR